jgi:hypothetical protein
MKRTRRIKWTAAALGAIGLCAMGISLRARATQDPWIEVYETSPRHFHIDAGGFTPGHLVGLGAFRPAPGPPAVPPGSGSHWFAGHLFVFARDGGTKNPEITGTVSGDFVVPTSVACNQMLPFIACDNNNVGGCLDWNGPIGSNPNVTADPSYNFLTCP